MDVVLCDELIEEIFQRVPSSSSPSVSLVSKRWLFLVRSATTSLSLRIPIQFPDNTSTDTSTSNISTSNTSSLLLSNILSHYPFLSSLTIVSSNLEENLTTTLPSSDSLLFSIVNSPCSNHLSDLRFLPNSPVSPAALLATTSSLTRLTALHITSILPLDFRWLVQLPLLKSFSLVNTYSKPINRNLNLHPNPEIDESDPLITLPIENISLSGIRAKEHGLGWLWRRCMRLRWLQLRACDGTGDGPTSAAFSNCLTGLVGLELRTCRVIADRVLLLAADRCHNLSSLLLYDGGSRDALHLFINRRGAALRTLDLRLPLDLHNDHLQAMAGEEYGLATLRIQSCCLVTGDGLRSLARAPAGSAIEELALVNCDVVEREPGLLTFMVQSMRQLKRVDLSHNETLSDKEVGAMLASCQNLVEIRLRGCCALTDASLGSLIKHCSKTLEIVDIIRCTGIGGNVIERLVGDINQLKEVVVEENKVSEEAKAMAAQKGIKIG
ncbi:F-box/LRR-repeat protein 4 [Carex littledalei]|uniref:F-box/LRR-repeat protein 4 n=1 Tax=Carex littledalei TaxID=544730 RepID=A0A833RDZ4_9POAL|nr:F-box/LRR-repeat protein 4 [Carex littledalei]